MRWKLLQITAKHRIFIAIAAVAFRKGISGLMAICKRQLMCDPFSGHLFVFRSRKGHAIKILTYDSQGFWLCQKRLSKGQFTNWPKTKEAAMQLSVPQYQALIWNNNVTQLQADSWRPI